jgi:hypothetical protein
MLDINFNYTTAFSRNIGWLTHQEQDLLKSKRIAIAGLGGVGGSHLLALSRLGVGAFHIADLDVFELANFNRQVGATIKHLDRAKVDVLAEMAMDINPSLNIRRFPQGINEANLTGFLIGADVYVDGLDFFAFNARKAVFAACHKLGIPAVTAAPLGMGTALISFMPGGMSFEDYFQWEGCSEAEQAMRFLLGLAPSGLHGSYLVDPSSIDLVGKKGPSTVMGCELCAGVTATEVLKILLQRGRVYSAPYSQQFDAYTNRFKRVWLPGGNRNPLQKLKLHLMKKR